MDWRLLVLAIVSSYLVGAFPTAYLVGRNQGVNIFEIGSGNMGATNVARALGGRYAVLTGLVDVLKGVLAVVIARWLVPQDPVTAGVAGALAALVGHSWSVFILFLTGELKGGKSVGVAAGTWLALAPFYLSVYCFSAFALLAWRVRIVSLSVLVTVGSGVLWLLLLVIQGALAPVMALYGVALFVLIMYRHRSNIDRLLRGVERRIGEKV